MKRKFLGKYGILHNVIGQPIHIVLIAPVYVLLAMSVPFVFLAKSVQEISFAGWAKHTSEFIDNVFR